MTKLQKNYTGKREYTLPVLVTKAEADLIRTAQKKGGHRSLANFIMFEVGAENGRKPAIVKSGSKRIQMGVKVTNEEAKEAFRVQRDAYFKSFSDWLVAVAARRIGEKAVDKFLVEF